MAWTAPKSFSAGSVLTAAELNTHLRDNLLVLKTNIADSGVVDAGLFNALAATAYALLDGTQPLTADWDVGSFEIQAKWFKADTNAPTSPALQNLYADNLCKAWAHVTNSGTPVLDADYNVSGLVDNGVGDVTVTFATALGAANYAAVASVNDVEAVSEAFPKTLATGSVLVITEDATGTQSDENFSVICIGGV